LRNDTFVILAVYNGDKMPMQKMTHFTV